MRAHRNGSEYEFKGKPEFERYLTSLRVDKYSKTTVKKHKSYLRQALKFINKEPDEIDFEDVERWRAEVSLNRDYERDTIFASISILRKFLRVIGKIDADKIKLPRKTKIIPPEKEIWLLPDEEKAIIKKSRERGIRSYAIVTLLLSSGIRAGELVNIDIPDINWEEQTIHIRHGKGDKSRYVCFDTETNNALQEYLKAREIPFEDKDALFTSNQKKRISYVIVSRAVKESSIRAGIKKPISPHKLRHTFVTRVIEITKDIPLAQKLAGHTDIETTMRYHHTQHETVVAKYRELLDNPIVAETTKHEYSNEDIVRKLDIKYLDGEIPKELYFKLREEYSQGSRSKEKYSSNDVAYN